jgi:hypothetical protein
MARRLRIEVAAHLRDQQLHGQPGESGEQKKDRRGARGGRVGYP